MTTITKKTMLGAYCLSLSFSPDTVGRPLTQLADDVGQNWTQSESIGSTA